MAHNRQPVDLDLIRNGPVDRQDLDREASTQAASAGTTTPLAPDDVQALVQVIEAARALVAIARDALDDADAAFQMMSEALAGVRSRSGRSDRSSAAHGLDNEGFDRGFAES